MPRTPIPVSTSSERIWISSPAPTTTVPSGLTTILSGTQAPPTSTPKTTTSQPSSARREKVIPFIDSCSSACLAVESFPTNVDVTSPRPLVALRGQKGVAVAVLRGPSRPFVEKRCCRCRSSRPFAALRGKRCCRCRSSRPFAALRGQKGVAVAVLRGPSRPFVEKGVAVAVLRGPSRPFVDKKVLPLPFFAALRGPSWKKVLPLPFFAALRGPSWTKRCCRCRSSRPFVALRGQKGVAVAVLRGPSWPFVEKGVAVAVLTAAPRVRSQARNPTMRCLAVAVHSADGVVVGRPGCNVRVRVGRARQAVSSNLRPAVDAGQKGVAVAVLRGPSRPFRQRRHRKRPRVDGRRHVSRPCARLASPAFTSWMA